MRGSEASGLQGGNGTNGERLPGRRRPRHDLILCSSSPGNERRTSARSRRDDGTGTRFVTGYCFARALREATDSVCDGRFFRGVSRVSPKSAHTTKQFPAVPSASTTVERVRLLGPRVKKTSGAAGLQPCAEGLV